MNKTRSFLAVQSAALGLVACPPQVEAAVAAPSIGSAPARASTEKSDDDPDDILVTGTLRRGSVRTAIPVEIQVDRVAIGALGADSLSEVIDAFKPQAESLRGDCEPILLLDGRRIGERSEVDDLPPEAILRVEIFPEDVALQYGYPPDRRVVNVILRPRYHAIEPSLRSTIALGGGRARYRAGFNYLRLVPGQRLSVDLSYRRETALVDKRSQAGAQRRWRLPRSARFAGNGSYARAFDGLTVTASAAGSWQRGRWKLGRSTGDLGLRRRESQTRGRLGVSVDGESGRWLWSASGALQLRSDSIVTRDTVGALSTVPGHSLRGSRREVQVDISASGPIGQLSTGPILASIGAGLAFRRQTARDPLLAGVRSVVRQDWVFASASLAIPLTRGEGATLFGEGKLMTARREGTLGRYGFGLRGSPLAGLSFSASYGRDRSLPDFTDLAALQLLTPNVRVYDFASASSHYVARLEGGNPGLRPPITRSYAIHLQYRPPARRELSVSLDFTDLALRRGASGPLGPTPQVEAAFPGRFERDLSGLLVRFDRRPLNIAREDRRQLRSGINLAKPTGDRTAPPTAAREGGRVQLALYHLWTLKDVAVLRAGSPQIDLLHGAAIGDHGGASRHRLEAQLGYSGARFGVRFSGNWNSPSKVVRPGPGDQLLSFRHGLTFDLRAYLKLDEMGDALGISWVHGRLNLAVDNLLGAKTRIRDQSGRKVSIYRGADDDSGRAIRISFRQIFH